MTWISILDDDSSEAESGEESGSESSSSSQSAESDSETSNHGAVPTPGHGIGSDGEQEATAPAISPASNRNSRSRSPSSVSHRSGSASPASGSPHSQRSKTAATNRSRSSSSENSKSPVSNRSNQSSPRSSYSGSPAHSDHSRTTVDGEDDQRLQIDENGASPAGSKKSLRKSISPASSSKSGRSRSHQGSQSPRSQRSRSSSSDRSGSPASSGKFHSSPKSGRREGSASPSQGSASPDSSPRSVMQNGDVKADDLGSEEENREKEVGERKQIRALSDDSNAGSVSPGENKEKPKKKKMVLSSEGSGSEDEKDPATAAALFGDADDISSEEEGGHRKEKRSDEENEERVSDEGERISGEEDKDASKEDGDKEEEVIPETRIDVEIPKIVCDTGRDLHFVKLPNFLSVETRPFSAETYEDEIDEEETLDEEGRARLKLKVENTIRWREALDKEGNTIKESNARLVRWSDGSLSLHLGSEIFDVYKQPLQGDHNHLFIRQGTGLQGQAVFRTKLTFRPHSTESFTHRKMTLSLADRSQKSSGIKVLSQVGHDPDQHRGEMIKKEEERLKASLRKESKVKRTRERGAGRSLNTSYLEPDREDGSDDDGAISLNAIKDKYKEKSKNENRRNIYSSDDDDSDLDTRRTRRVDKSRALKDSDEEEEEEEGSHDEGSQGSGRASPVSDES